MKKPTVAKDNHAKEPKAPKSAKTPKEAGTKSNSVDPEKRELFLADLGKYQRAMEKLEKAKEAVAEAKADFKNDGFSMDQVKTAILLSSPEGEAEFRMKIANNLLAAQYIGAAVGTQLALFLEPDRTPATDIAADLGTRDSMENKAANPPYDPSTPQHKSYMEAYHADQERQLLKGIKQLEPTEMN